MTGLDDRAREFLEEHASAAMVTLRRDGTPHVARVGLGVVDGRLWSSGLPSRLRTGHLRRDPRSTLFVYDPSGPRGAWRWLGLETTTTILDGADAPDQSVLLFRAMQARLSPPPKAGRLMWEAVEKTEAEFREIMVQEQRLIYEFEIKRAYGLY